jgi:hypothetical protein
MTARDVDQVLVGPGQLYAAPLGEAFPATAETVPAGNWEDVGYSDEGGAFAWDQERQEVNVAEEVDAISDERTGIDYTFTVTLAQLVFENMVRALGGGTITAVPGPPVERTYEPPVGGAEAAIALLFRYENENDDGAGTQFHTDLQMQQVKSVGAAEIPFQLAPQKSIMAVEFKLELPSAGAIFTFREYISLT